MRTFIPHVLLLRIKAPLLFEKSLFFFFSNEPLNPQTYVLLMHLCA